MTLAPHTPFPASPVAPRAGRPSTAAVSALVVAIVLWGANWPIMKLGLAHVTPLWFSALRFATGAVALLLYQAFRGDLRLPRSADLPFIGSVGILQMAGFTVLGAFAMMNLPAGRSAILSYTTPLWVLPASVLLFREQVSRSRLAGVALAAIGVATLVNPLAIDWGNWRVLNANLMLLGASVCWAVCILHLRYGGPTATAYELALGQMVLATVILVPLAWAFEGPFTGDGTAMFWATTIFVGPIATAFCFCAVNAASAWLSATAMSTAMLGVPVTGVALSVLTMGETLSLPLLVGSAAILAGIGISAIPHRENS